MQITTILMNTILLSFLAYIIIGCLFSLILKWIESRQKNPWIPPNPIPKIKDRPREK